MLAGWRLLSDFAGVRSNSRTYAVMQAKFCSLSACTTAAEVCCIARHVIVCYHQLAWHACKAAIQLYSCVQCWILLQHGPAAAAAAMFGVGMHGKIQNVQYSGSSTLGLCTLLTIVTNCVHSLFSLRTSHRCLAAGQTSWCFCCKNSACHSCSNK